MLDKKDIEFIISHESAIREAVQEKRTEQGIKNGGGSHCGISDPTTTAAIKNLEEITEVTIAYGPNTGYGRGHKRIRYPERWLKAIEWTREYYNEPSRAEQGRLMAMHYNQNLSRDEACEQLHIGYGKYHTMLNDVTAFCAGVATGLKASPRWMWK